MYGGEGAGVQAQGSVKRLESMYLFWRYINTIKLNISTRLTLCDSVLLDYEPYPGRKHVVAVVLIALVCVTVCVTIIIGFCRTRCMGKLRYDLCEILHNSLKQTDT